MKSTNEKEILKKNIERRLMVLEGLSKQGFKNDNQSDFYKKMLQGLIDMENKLQSMDQS